MLRLAEILIEHGAYSKAEQCADLEESNYHYKLIELLSYKDEIDVAKRWIDKYSITEEDKLSSTAHIVLSLYRQKKINELESIIAKVNNYWKVSYYTYLAKQSMEILKLNQ